MNVLRHMEGSLTEVNLIIVSLNKQHIRNPTDSFNNCSGCCFSFRPWLKTWCGIPRVPIRWPFSCLRHASSTADEVASAADLRKAILFCTYSYRKPRSKLYC